MVVETNTDLPDPDSREPRALAEGRGPAEGDIKDDTHPTESPRFEVELPLIRSQEPTVLRPLTNSEIEELLD
jgi:hypothetical protein